MIWGGERERKTERVIEMQTPAHRGRNTDLGDLSERELKKESKTVLIHLCSSKVD